MIDSLTLPPLYRLVRIASDDSAMQCAIALAKDGADPATLAWSDRADCLDCAIVLTPTEPWARAAPVMFSGALGMGDALASILPPGVEVGFGWPGDIHVNERRAASIELRAPENITAEDIPEWLVLGAGLSITGQPQSSKRDSIPQTTLSYENCVDVTAAAALESFSRHFLAWVNRWQDDGFAPLRAAWLARIKGGGKSISVALAGQTVMGEFLDVTADGDLRMATESGLRDILLTDAIGR
ncbi:MAG: hypothetical protein GY791_16150 [Alphaproteobacteria bacterium]|nr:hypothetical protein [Alphaproteobacteria bacterium]